MTGTAATGINDIWFDRYYVSGNKSLISLSAYTALAGPVTYELGIYADDGTGATPTTLIAETGPLTIGPATMWNTVPLSPVVYLSSGVNYWLAMHASIAYYVSGGAIPYAYQTAGVFGTLPGTFAGTSTGSLFTFSIYGTTCP